MNAGNSTPLPGVLEDAELKLARAEHHMKSLSAAIQAAGLRPDFYAIPLREEIDENNVLHMRVDDDTTQPNVWGPIIGDVLYNLRSCLDNLWWQLACKYLGREPTEEESLQIQFPILKRGAIFNVGSAGHWVGEAAADLARQFQTPDQDHPAELFGLEELRRLGNIDKHRKIHVAVYKAGMVEAGATWVGGGPEPVDRMDFSLPGATFHPLRASPRAGDLVMSIPPDCWIREPEFVFDIYQKGYISIDGRVEVLGHLAAMRDVVRNVLNATTLVLEGKKVRIEYGSERVNQNPEDPPNATAYTLPDTPGPVTPEKPSED